MISEERKKEIADFAASLSNEIAPATPAAEDKPSFIGGNLAAGVDNLQASLGGAEAYAGRALQQFGADSLGGSLVHQGNAISERNRAEAATEANGVMSLEDAHGVGDTVNFIAGSALRSLPAMAATFAGGLAAAAVAPEAAVAAGVAKVASKALPFVGAALPSAALELGDIHQATEEAGAGANTNLLGEGSAALAAGALDSLLPGKVLGKVMGKAAKPLAQQKKLPTAAREAAKTAVLEGTTEAIQTALEAAGTASSTGHSDLSGWQLIDSFVAGGAMGGAIGSGVGYHTADARSDAEIKNAITLEAKPEDMSTTALLHLHDAVDAGTDPRAVRITKDMLQDELDDRLTRPIAELTDTQLIGNLDVSLPQARTHEVLGEMESRAKQTSVEQLKDTVDLLTKQVTTQPDQGMAATLDYLKKEYDRAKPLDEQIVTKLTELGDDVSLSLLTARGSDVVQARKKTYDLVDEANKLGIQLQPDVIADALKGGNQLQSLLDAQSPDLGAKSPADFLSRKQNAAQQESKEVQQAKATVKTYDDAVAQGFTLTPEHQAEYDKAKALVPVETVKPQSPQEFLAEQKQKVSLESKEVQQAKATVKTYDDAVAQGYVPAPEYTDAYNAAMGLLEPEPAKQAVEPEPAKQTVEPEPAKQTYDGFFDDKPNGRTKTLKAALEKPLRKGAGVTRKAEVERLVSEGYQFKDGVLRTRKGRTYNTKPLTKAGVEYAEHLIANAASRTAALRSERARVAARTRLMVNTEEDDLHTFIRKRGGVSTKKGSEYAGEFKQFAESYPPEGNIRTPLGHLGKGAVSADDMAEAAWEAGYIGEHSVQELYEAIEQGADAVYTPAGINAQHEKMVAEELALDKEADDFIEAAPYGHPDDGDILFSKGSAWFDAIKRRGEYASSTSTRPPTFYANDAAITVLAKSPQYAFVSDIPNGDWLASKQEAAMASDNMMQGSITGYFTGERNPMVSLSTLAAAKGLAGEEAYRDNPSSGKYFRLAAGEVIEEPPLVLVNHRGEAYIAEGNHRIAAAAAAGIKYMPVSIRYMNGGELVAHGDMSPKAVLNGIMRWGWEESRKSVPRSHSAASSTMAEATAALHKAGARKAMRDGMVILHEEDDLYGGAQGWFDTDGTIHIVAAHNTPAEIESTLKHELLHYALSHVSPARKDALARLDIVRGEGWALEAYERAKLAGTPDIHMDDEILAYAVTNYVDGTASLRKFVDHLINKVKAVLRTFGMRFELTPAELHDVAASRLSNLKLHNTRQDRLYSNYTSKAMTDARRAFDEAKEKGVYADVSDSILSEYASLLDKIGARKLTYAESRMDELQTAGKRLTDSAFWRSLQANIQDSNIELLYSDKQKRGAGVRADNSKLYMSATMSRHAHSQATMLIDVQGGQLRYNKASGEVERIEGKRSLNAILGDVEGDIDLMFAYAAAKRAAVMDKVGADGFLSQSEYEATMRVSKASPHYANWNKVLDELDEFDDNKLQYAVDAGAITADAKDALRKYGNYIPLSRIKEDGSVTKPHTSIFGNGLVKQSEGETGRNVGDIVANMQSNVMALMQASAHAIAMRNIEEHLLERDELGRSHHVTPQGEDVWLTDDEAKNTNAAPVYRDGVWRKARPLKKVLASAQSIHSADMKMIAPTLNELGLNPRDLSVSEQRGFHEVVAAIAPNGKRDISFVMNGERHYRTLSADAENKAMVTAISSLGDSRGLAAYEDGGTHAFMQVAIKAKTLLTNLVTKTPPFWLANHFRDSLSVMGTTDLNLSYIDILRGWKSSFDKDENYAKAWANGALPSVGAYDDVSSDVALSSVAKSNKTLLHMAVKGYNNFSAHFENAARLAVFKAAAEGKGVDPKTGEPRDRTLDEAAFLALDTLDFARRGQSKMVGFFLDTVPFLNARIQGLGRLGRGLDEHKAAIAKVGSIMFIMSAMNAVMNADNDEYKKLTDEQKDLYWYFYIPNTKVPFALPKPFEFGLIATAAERMVGAMNGDDGSKVLNERLLFALTTTLSINPTPQLIKPLVQLAGNTNWFTGRSIVPMYQESLYPTLQESPFQHTTSTALAKGFDAIIPSFAPDSLRNTLTSPRKVEFLMRSYLGTAADITLSITDHAANPLLDRVKPSTRLMDMTPFKRFFPEFETKNTRYMGRLYDMNSAVQKLVGSERALRKSHDLQQIVTLRKEHPAAHKYRARITSVMGRVRSYNKKIMHLMRNSEHISPQALRVKIDMLVAERNTAAGLVDGLYEEFK